MTTASISTLFVPVFATNSAKNDLLTIEKARRIAGFFYVREGGAFERRTVRIAKLE